MNLSAVSIGKRWWLPVDCLLIYFARETVAVVGYGLSLCLGRVAQFVTGGTQGTKSSVRNVDIPSVGRRCAGALCSAWTAAR